MKMNSAQIEQTLHTSNAAELNAEAIPAEHERGRPPRGEAPRPILIRCLYPRRP